MASITGIRTHRSSWYPSSGWTTDTSKISVSLQAGPTKDVDGSSTKRKLMTALKITTSSGSGIDYINKITITAKGYRDSKTSGNLRASICDTDPSTVSGLGDSVATIRNIAVSNTSEMTDSTAVDTTETMTFSFTGTFAPGKTYYIVFYTGDFSVFYIFTKSLSAFTVSDTSVKKTYKISYNANGGSGAPSAQTKYEDVDLTLSSAKPSKGETTEIIKGNITIIGYGNGGYFGNDTTKKSTSITGTSSRPDRITYDFVKWNTASDGSGTDYSSGGIYKTNSNATLYAQYSKSISQGNTTYSDNEVSRLETPQKDNETSSTFTVKYDTCGGNSISDTSAPVTKKWTFGGWATSDNATSANAATSYNSNMELYAYWTSTLNYTTVTLPTPSRTGYTFQGWATSSTATSGLSAGTKVEIRDNVTYYATWKSERPDGTVRIYIDGQGYRMAQVYLYTNNKWNLTVPYLYDGSWKMST